MQQIDFVIRIQEQLSLVLKMSGEEDERKCTHNSEKGEWEREMKSLKSQLGLYLFYQ